MSPELKTSTQAQKCIKMHQHLIPPPKKTNFLRGAQSPDPTPLRGRNPFRAHRYGCSICYPHFKKWKHLWFYSSLFCPPTPRDVMGVIPTSFITQRYERCYQLLPMQQSCRIAAPTLTLTLTLTVTLTICEPYP